MNVNREAKMWVTFLKMIYMLTLISQYKHSQTNCSHFVQSCQYTHKKKNTSKHFFFGASARHKYTHWTAKLTLVPFCSSLDPIVNVSCKNCCVCSLSKIFHQNVMP